MRLAGVTAALLMVSAVLASVAIAFGFDDGVKPPRGILGAQYSFAFKGRNGCPPYTFVFQNGTLPPGLTMGTDGVVTGVPTTVGRYSFWVELRDSGCTGGSCPPAGPSCSFPSQRPFTIDIVAPLSVDAPSPIVTENGVRLGPMHVRATGGRGPYLWELTNAPDWLGIGSQGMLAGRAQAPGRFRLTIALTDFYDDRTTADAMVVVRARLAITTVRLGPSRVGRRFRAPLQTNGGVTPFRWNVISGRFPVGVRLDTSTGLIVGTPQKAGVYPLTLAVRDAVGVASTKRITLRVARAQ